VVFPRRLLRHRLLSCSGGKPPVFSALPRRGATVPRKDTGIAGRVRLTLSCARGACVTGHYHPRHPQPGNPATGTWNCEGQIMRRVITYGTFDTLHHGHIRLLRRAKALGDYLIVALSTDEFNIGKGKQAFFSYEDRKFDLEAVRYVDLVIPERTWEQKVEDVRLYHVDVFAMGDDWTGKFDFLKPQCEVVYMPRTEGISSTQIRKLMAANG